MSDQEIELDSNSDEDAELQDIYKKQLEAMQQNVDSIKEEKGE